MPTIVLLWVWCCAYLNCAGWTLSALHQLNACGYAVVLLIGGIGLWVWHRQSSSQFFPQIRWQKQLRRFRKPFPLAFLVLALMAFLGGALHAPTNYDALAYRVPRVLHWLAADQWHWIHSFFDRINNRSCGIEWVSAPFLALLHTDRLLFLINIFSFVLLPGLVFSLFTRLGVRRRTAWHWMWLAPTGYCFVLQAGSIGNDLFGVTFALAAVDFALRANLSRLSRDFFASGLAAAMMTSAKTSSLPLLLPWAIALLPSLKLILRWPLRTVAVGIITIFASALPTIVLNVKFSGDWSGASLAHGNGKHAALLRTAVNTGLIMVNNFTPPVFPFARTWDRCVTNLIPAGTILRLGGVMLEPAAANFSVEEMQVEESAGLGFGVSVLLLASVAGGFIVRQRKSPAAVSPWLICVRWSPVISLFAVMTQSNLAGIARILTPYYLLLLPPLLVGGGHESLVRKTWWRVAAAAVFLIAAGLLIISPARPLFPADVILSRLAAHDFNSKMPARMEEVYSVYARRNDAFAPVRDGLPPGLEVLGMITYDDPETSLWRPWGARRIEHVCPGDTAADLKARGIEYILLHQEVFERWFDCPLNAWLEKMNAQVVQKIPLDLRASRGPRDWYLVKLN
jgi:hypothetical protein